MGPMGHEALGFLVGIILCAVIAAADELIERYHRKRHVDRAKGWFVMPESDHAARKVLAKKRARHG